MSNETTKQGLTKDELKAKMLRLKKRLPYMYMQKFLDKFPQYNTKEGKSQVHAVVNLRTANEDIIEKLESIAL